MGTTVLNPCTVNDKEEVVGITNDFWLEVAKRSLVILTVDEVNGFVVLFEYLLILATETKSLNFHESLYL